MSVLEETHKMEPMTAFSVLVDCHSFNWNLNHTLGICQLFYAQIKDQTGKKEKEEDNADIDEHFSCFLFVPS